MVWHLMLFALVVFAPPEERVDEALAKLQCFQVAFKQETASAFFDATVSSGVLTICRPGRMRMEYREGERRLMIWDGTTCYEYDSLADAVSTQPQQDVKGEPLVRLLLYEGDVAKHFHVRQVPDLAEPTFELTPKHDEGYQVRLILAESQLPSRLEVIGNDGEETLFTFEDYQMLEAPEKETFEIPVH